MTTVNPNVANIKTMLLLGGFSFDDLNQIVETVRYAQAQLGKNQIRSLQIGQQVSWIGKRGYQTGKVTKIAIKYVTVNTGMTSWRVPASMLMAV